MTTATAAKSGRGVSGSRRSPAVQQKLYCFLVMESEEATEPLFVAVDQCEDLAMVRAQAFCDSWKSFGHTALICNGDASVTVGSVL